MSDFGSARIRDEVILIARILLAALFLIFGWRQLIDYSGTAASMAQIGLPLPSVAALVAIVVEFFGGIALILGAWTRPVALIVAIYTLAAALIAHRYWSMTGGARMANMTNFYKNVSIMGGFLLLYLTGAGKYSIDARLGRAAPLRTPAP